MWLEARRLAARDAGKSGPFPHLGPSPTLQVANEPIRGNRYSIFQSYETLSYADRKAEWLTPHFTENAKAMVWTEIALNAPDQLRQRMAWALSQVLVVSSFGISGRRFEAELWVTYYVGPRHCAARHPYHGRVPHAPRS